VKSSLGLGEEQLKGCKMKESGANISLASRTVFKLTSFCAAREREEKVQTKGEYQKRKMRNRCPEEHFLLYTQFVGWIRNEKGGGRAGGS